MPLRFASGGDPAAAPAPPGPEPEQLVDPAAERGAAAGSPSAVVWGAAGHAKVVAEAARTAGFAIAGFLDDVDPGRAGEPFGRATVLGGAEQLERLRAAGVANLLLGFGDNRGRLRVAALARAHGFALPPIVHEHANVSSGVVLGDGCVVIAGACIGVDATFGEAVVVNGLAGVGHDAVIGPGTHVGSGSIIAGHAVTGACVTTGPNAVIARALTVGADTVIGAGAVVLADLPERVLALGVPARVVRTIDPPA